MKTLLLAVAVIAILCSCATPPAPAPKPEKRNSAKEAAYLRSVPDLGEYSDEYAKEDEDRINEIIRERGGAELGQRGGNHQWDYLRLENGYRDAQGRPWAE